ncbi:MAG TPA: hypothetical protein VFZ35_02580, partial [Sphingomicrobium sp.]
MAVAWVLLTSLGIGAGDPVLTGLRLAKGLVLLGVAGLLFWRRQADPVAALLSLAFLTWAITSSVGFVADDIRPLVLDRIRFLLFALALLLFPDGDWYPRWTRHAAIASAGVFVIGLLEATGLLTTRIYLPAAIACVLAAIGALVASFRAATDDAVRQQLKWVALGLAAGVGLILSARLGASLMPFPTLWEAMFQLGIVIVALGFLVSLLRYRLYDAESAISRSAALAALTLILVCTFAATEAAIEWVGQQYLGAGLGNISAAMGAAVAAVLLNPLHERISGWAEHQFQRDLVKLKRDLPDLLADLVASATPRQLGAAILPRINVGVHSAWAALVVGRKVIAAHGISHAAASALLRDGRKDPGNHPALTMLALDCPFSGQPSWLVLGPRPDGTPLGSDDLSALNESRVALRHALSWTQHRERASIAGRRKDSATLRRFQLLERRVDAI